MDCWCRDSPELMGGGGLVTANQPLLLAVTAQSHHVNSGPHSRQRPPQRPWSSVSKRKALVSGGSSVPGLNQPAERSHEA